ncbi:E2/E3 hybrid ubiquitin-protein ligase UBE2O [Biomphalaria glabrata]|nr:E2/E3 hybrid ubiquitin-protein ligase UBE2O-like [Biomphalaria glabrata]
MATCNLFEEDEVYIENQGKGISFGLVLENGDFFSSSDEDEADNKIDERIQKGTVRVAWHPTGKETVVAENKVHLVDRSLMPGDIVRHLIQGQETQCGFVTDVDIRCNVHVLRTNKYIYNINSKDLQPIQKFCSDQEVLFNSWLGRVENVNYELVIIFQDGAKCQVDEDDLFNFEDVSDKRSRHGEFSFCHHYPGQELKGTMDNFSDAKWLHSTPRYCSRVANKKGKTFNVLVTVEKIVTKSVEIQWVFRGYEKMDNTSGSVNPPPRFIEGENVEKLQVLDWFSHCNIQIGDRMRYTINNDDVVSDVTPRKAFDPKMTLVKDAPFKIDEGLDNKNQISLTSTSHNGVEKELDETDDADLEDDDFESESDEKLGASSGRNTGSRKKKNRGHKGALRHKPGKVNQSSRLTCGKKRIQKERLVKPDETVEVEVEFTMSWVTVMWQDGSMEKDIPSFHLFPVHHLDDFEFFPGDFVLSNIELAEPVDYGVVVKADHHERTCIVHWYKAYDIGKANKPTLVEGNCEISVYDIKDHPDYKYRPGHSIVRVGGFENTDLDENETLQTIGQILQLDPNGHLIIKWADGRVSQHYPQEIFVVTDEAENVSEDSWDSEEDSNDSSETWETESEHEIFGEESAKLDPEDGTLDQDILCEHKQELDSLLGRAETALSRLQNHLNNFGVAVHSPECFHDIIRIYRSCHDLDKILQSSFFNDPELQSLISQAKAELKRDKVNKFSKHLSLLFDTWSKNLPLGSNDNVGTVAVAGKTIKVGMLKGKEFEISIALPVEKEASASQGNGSDPTEDCLAEGSLKAESGACSLEDTSAANIKKEMSEPALSKTSKELESSNRRLSDPFSDPIATNGAKIKKKYQDALVGENCVSKASKRTKSDNYDDSGREAKKSRDETKCANLIAQELCSLICQNLQKQILRIHEEVNKRTNRLLSSSKANKQDAQTSPLVNGEVNNPVNPESADIVPNIDNNDIIKVSVSTEAVVPAKTVSHQSNLEFCAVDNNCAVNQKIGSENDTSNIILTSESCSSLEMEALPDEVESAQVQSKGFEMLGEVQPCQKYVSQESQPANPRSFRTAVKKELKLFQTSLPDGIFVKGFENRLDLYSVMILGPEGTPYEDAVFLFDLMLPNDYPSAPPLCYYHSFCTDRLNPNLYEDGKVCVSLLGTWTGKGTEVWTSKSNLLQVLLSIQGLILVSEPYYNEAGYEKQRGTQVGLENSRMYNEMAIIKTIQSLIKMCAKLPVLFNQEIYHYLKAHGPKMIARLRKWTEESETQKCKATTDTDCNNIPTDNLLTESTVGQSNQPQEQLTSCLASADSVMSGDICRQTVQETKKANTHCQEHSIGDCNNLQVCDENIEASVVKEALPSSVLPPSEICVQESTEEKAPSQSETNDQEMCSTDTKPLSISKNCEARCKPPQFPLFPMSKGFRLTLQKTLNLYEKVLDQLEAPSLLK